MVQFFKKCYIQRCAKKKKSKESKKSTSGAIDSNYNIEKLEIKEKKKTSELESVKEAFGSEEDDDSISGDS